MTIVRPTESGRVRVDPSKIRVVPHERVPKSHVSIVEQRHRARRGRSAAFTMAHVGFAGGQGDHQDENRHARSSQQRAPLRVTKPILCHGRVASRAATADVSARREPTALAEVACGVRSASSRGRHCCGSATVATPPCRHGGSARIKARQQLLQVGRLTMARMCCARLGASSPALPRNSLRDRGCGRSNRCQWTESFLQAQEWLFDHEIRAGSECDAYADAYNELTGCREHVQPLSHAQAPGMP